MLFSDTRKIPVSRNNEQIEVSFGCKHNAHTGTLDLRKRDYGTNEQVKQSKQDMDSFFNHAEDDDSDDELLLQPSGLLKSSPQKAASTAMTATTTASLSVLDTNSHVDINSSQHQQHQLSSSTVSASAVVSQVESSSSSSSQQLTLTLQTTISDDGTPVANNSNGTINAEEIFKEGNIMTINLLREVFAGWPPTKQTNSNFHTFVQIFSPAQDVFKCKIIHYSEIHSTSLLKWYAKPKTKRNKPLSTSSYRKKQRRSITTEQFEFVRSEERRVGKECRP